MFYFFRKKITLMLVLIATGKGWLISL